MKTKMPNLRKACRWRALLRLAFVAALVRLPLQLLGSTLDNGLIAWYPFTGNANDASTNGNNGTVMGAQLTTDRNGVPNQAYLFNGTTDYINVGQGVKPTFPLTITAWIYPSASGVDVDSHTIFRSGTFNSTGNFNGVMFAYSGRGYLYGIIGSGPFSDPNNYRSRQMTYPPSVISSNQWTHVALAWTDFQTTKFYVNGVLQADGTTGDGSSGTTIGTSATDGAIGIRDNPSYPAPFVGKLDEIRVYSRELTPSEINTLAVEPPQVAIQPSSVTTNAGATVVFTANATGAAPLTYRWQVQGTNISGATTSTLTLTNVKPSDSGTYRVVVSNSAGTNFADATLTVPAQAVSAMPQQYTNGVSFTVTISVWPPTNTSFYTIQDQPPTGWPVTQISNNGTNSGGKVKWVVFNDPAPRVLSYVITPPAGAVGTNLFAGTATFNGATTLTITGVRDIYNEIVRLSISAMDLFGDGVLYANLTVFGKAGASYHILVTDGLEQPSPWRTNDTVTLSGSSANWFDQEPMTNARRFYKAQAAP
ncbi:MAG: hypothetical protein DME22_02745 [Verrucomicrobia bacterium]|nr:MAG: hypothetical protein DME22_02745 [Verrucomicrobiota bacterium]